MITSWNPGAERMFGYKAQEVIGTPMARLFPVDRLDEEPRILARLKAGERIDHFETVRLAKDGRHVPVSVTISPVKDAAGKVVGASKIVHDLSQQRRAEEWHQLILRSALDGILMLDGRNLGILEVNDAYCNMTGYQLRQVMIQDVRAGMVLDEDVASRSTNVLVFKAGTVLTVLWIEPLGNFARNHGVQERVRVRIPEWTKDAVEMSPTRKM